MDGGIETRKDMDTLGWGWAAAACGAWDLVPSHTRQVSLCTLSGFLSPQPAAAASKLSVPQLLAVPFRGALSTPLVQPLFDFFLEVHMTCSLLPSHAYG